VAPVDRVAHTIYVTNYSGHGVCDRTSVAFPSGLSALVVLRTPGHEDIVHLRDVLGEQTYESLAHKGEAMTTAAIVAYAYDQIDQARAELNAVLK
jgi:hypothetical protein